jgi:uncharacterized protein YuzE
MEYIKIEPRRGVAGPLVLDLDRDGRLLGVEVSRASRVLPQALLDTLLG